MFWSYERPLYYERTQYDIFLTTAKLRYADKM